MKHVRIGLVRAAWKKTNLRSAKGSQLSKPENQTSRVEDQQYQKYSESRVEIENQHCQARSTHV